MITLVGTKFTVKSRYVEECFDENGNIHDDYVSFLDLMVDLNDSCGDEHWVVDDDAARAVAKGYLENSKSA